MDHQIGPYFIIEMHGSMDRRIGLFFEIWIKGSMERQIGLFFKIRIQVSTNRPNRFGLLNRDAGIHGSPNSAGFFYLSLRNSDYRNFQNDS